MGGEGGGRMERRGRMKGGGSRHVVCSCGSSFNAWQGTYCHVVFNLCEEENARKVILGVTVSTA
jgi:hypothetical protein